MSFDPNDWSTRARIQSDPALVVGSSNLTDFPSLLGSIPDSIYTALQTGEIYTNGLLSDPLLKAYYRFTSAALTTDSSGESHTLTAISDPAATSLRFGNGVAFDGNDAYSSVDHADFKPTGAFAIGKWIQTSTTGATQILFQSYSKNTNVGGIKIQITSSNLALCLSGDNTGEVEDTDYAQAIGVTNICDGSPHFIVGQWTGTHLQIWVDGVLEDSQAWTIAPAYAATNYVRIGCGNRTGTNEQFFTGSSTDAFLVNGRSLSASEIKSLYLGGADLRITTDATGLAEVPFEIVELDRAGKTSVIWAKIPSLDYDDPTPLYLWAGNSNVIAYDASATYGSQNVWANNWDRGVYHMNDLTKALVGDSTANGNSGTKGAVNQPLEVAAQIGRGQDFSGGAYTVKLTNPTSWRNDTQGAVRLVFRTPSSFSATIVLLETGYSGSDNQYVTMAIGSTGTLFFQARRNGSGNQVSIVGSFNLSTDTDYIVEITSTGSAYKLYINGVEDTSAVITPTGTAVDGDWFGDITNIDRPAIGVRWRSGDSNHYTDIIDEVWVSSTAPSADWIVTEYNNQDDPSSFWLESSFNPAIARRRLLI